MALDTTTASADLIPTKLNRAKVYPSEKPYFKFIGAEFWSWDWIEVG